MTTPPPRTRPRAAPICGGLLVLSLLQMAGDALGSTPVRGLAAATAASPAPKVFTSFGDYEPFSTRFFVEWDAPDGIRRVALTPEVYARLRGPYNRRNTYGAAIAFAPVGLQRPMVAPMVTAVLQRAACGDRAPLRELGIDADDALGPLRLTYDPVTPAPDVPRAVEVTCP